MFTKIARANLYTTPYILGGAHLMAPGLTNREAAME